MIDRVPEELWTEVHDSVQEAGIKTIPKKKKCEKAKQLSEEALQILWKKGMATHSSNLIWRIPWTEDPGRLQSTGSQRVGHD